MTRNEGLLRVSAAYPQTRGAARPLPVGLPVPREQSIDLLDRIIGDTGEDVDEPRLRVDFAELGCLDEREHDRCKAAEGVDGHAGDYI